MQNIKNEQKGFTLVELVIAVALVGVLSIVALPKIMGVSVDARQASLNAVAGTLTSMGANNYIARSSDATKGVVVGTCGASAAFLDGGALPTGFTFGDSDAVATADVKTSCAVETTTAPTLTANFDVYGVS